MGIRPTTTDRREQLFRDAVQVICTDYANPLTVDHVAHAIATSRRQLQRVLAEVGGTTLRDLLRDVRMRQARHALSDDGGSVRDIARSVGYEQAADFTKTFRRCHGVPPTEFRARGREAWRARSAA